jgi:hypothetical protein
MLEGDELALFLSARCGKLTGSKVKDAIAIGKNGQPLQSRANLIRDILAERLTGSSVRHYVNAAMEWGLEWEEPAKSQYEAFTGCFITPCGVYDHPRIDMFCATPDGLLGADGLIEVGKVPEEHKPQMLAQLACTGRKFVEFVAYDPRVKKMSPLFIRRFEPIAAEIADIEAKAEAFLAEVDKAWEILTTAAA